VNADKGLIVFMMAVAAVTFANAARADEEPKIGLHGSAGFGYTESRGNSDSLRITADTRLQYHTGGPWRYDANAQVVSRDDSGENTEERYEARGTANYYWTEDDYFFGRLDWRKDNFGGVREEWVPSAGVGRVLIRNERHDLRGELGAGYRFADLSDGTSEEGAALSGGVKYRWTISDSAEFFQNAFVQWSSDNTFMESETGLRTLIVGNLMAKFNYVVRHNTDVPAGRANTDFFTTIGLEYLF
jgi:putative salt-induced outer membrane protein